MDAIGTPFPKKIKCILTQCRIVLPVNVYTFGIIQATKTKKMKKLILMLLVIICTQGISQTFDGVYIGGSVSDVLAKYKAKGYRHENNFEGVVQMVGRVAGKTCDLFIVYTPKSKTVCKVAVIFPEKTSWYTLKSEYIEYKEVLEEIYGEPENEYFTFKSPYYEGDGYELSAIKMDKHVISAFWFNHNNTNIAIRVTEYSQVNISYENARNMALLEMEKTSLNKNAF